MIARLKPRTPSSRATSASRASLVARGFSRALTVGLAIGLLATPHGQAPPPDTILVNGHVITVDARFAIAQAVAIAGGTFTAVGSSADIRKLAGPSTQTVDLQGRTMIPGLADGHLHDAGGG